MQLEICDTFDRNEAKMNEASEEKPTFRILLLADASSIHTEKWIRGLAGSGPVELHLVTMNPAGVRAGLRDVAALKGIEEFYAGPVKEGGGNWRYLLNVPRVARAIRRMQPDVVVAIYLTSYGLVGALAKGNAVMVHVMIGSDVMITPGKHWLHERLSRYALARGDLYVSSSNAMTGRLRELVDVPEDVILTQQYGVEDWVMDHPVLPKTYGFVSNRAWVANSNISLLLRIFGRLRSPGTLALIGSGGPFEAQIRREAARDSRIVALGALEYRQNIEVIARSGFYFSMTASDGASLSLMEAMALGAIPVVSDIEPNREWVRQGVNGVLVSLADESAAAQRIETLLAQPRDQLDAMRERNRAIIRDRGSLTRNMARFRERLCTVIARRRERQH